MAPAKYHSQRNGPRRTLGFSSIRRLALFIAFTTAVAVFCIPRLRYLDIDNFYCACPGRAVPGECYLYGRPGMDRLGLVLHLAGIMPATVLSCLQLIPVTRRNKYLALHRVNGYMIVVLAVISTTGATMLISRALGGGATIQAGLSVVSVMFVVSMFKALLAIRNGRVDEHRAWMLRAWLNV